MENGRIAELVKETNNDLCNKLYTTFQKYVTENADNLRQALECFGDFYEEDDVEHGIKHVLDVYKRAMNIVIQQNYLNTSNFNNVNFKNIAFAAIGHDIFSRTDRDEHHTKAYDLIMRRSESICAAFGLNPTDVKIIAMACKEHRAKFKGTPYSPLSELISAADRDEPKLESLIKRIYGCAIDKDLLFDMEKGKPIPNIKVLIDASLRNTEGVNFAVGQKLPLPIVVNYLRLNNYREELIKTYVHLIEKYSRHGYANLNEVYKEFYDSSLREFYKEIDGLSFLKLLEYLPSYITRVYTKSYDEMLVRNETNSLGEVPGIHNIFPSSIGGNLILSNFIPTGIKNKRVIKIFTTVCVCGHDVNVATEMVPPAQYANDRDKDSLANHNTPGTYLCKKCGLLLNSNDLPNTLFPFIIKQKMYLYHVG